jgi:hypothetical protein
MIIAKLFARADDTGPTLRGGFTMLSAIAAMNAQQSEIAERLSERFVRAKFLSISTASLFRCKWILAIEASVIETTMPSVAIRSAPTNAFRKVF